MDNLSRPIRQRRQVPILIVLLLGVHTGLSVTSAGSVIFPYALTAAAAAVLIFMNRRVISADAYRAIGLLLLFFTLHGLLLSARDHSYVENLRSMLALYLAIAAGLAFFLGVRSDPERAGRGMLFLAIFLIVGAMAEARSVEVRHLSDSVRLYVNDWRTVYESDLRDALNYGGYRPRFLATEPSALAFTISISLIVWLLSIRRISIDNIFIYAILSLTATFIIRSPVLILGFFVGLLLAKQKSQAVLFQGSAQRAALLLTVIVILIGVPVYFALNYLGSGATVGYFQTGSFFLREIGPTLVVAHTAITRPLTGYGMGASITLMQLITTVYQANDVYYLFPRLYAVIDPKSLISNAFLEMWVYFGIFGTIVIIYLVSRLMKLLAIRQPAMILACSAAIMVGLAGFNTPQVWIVLFALGASMPLASATRRAARPRSIGQTARAESGIAHTATARRR